MEAKKALEKLQSSKVFREWQKNNKKCYLTYIFYLVGKNKEEEQIGYYNKEKNLITAFDVSNEVKKSAEEAPFKKEEDEIKKLDINSVKIGLNEAIAIVEDLQKKKYPAEKPIEVIAILQNLDEFGTVFNVTHVTQSFKTLNVKVSAENGDIVHEELVSIVQFPANKQSTQQ